jgi:glycosyltransferase involved in cell wall biosynthesis
MQAFKEAGFDVHAVSMEDGSTAKIKEAGFKFHTLKIQGKGANPLADLSLLKQYKAIFKKEKPDVVLNFTIKPVIYASIAAKQLGIPVINNIAGLGTLFNQTTWVTKVAVELYKYSQKKIEHIFFQNQDDIELFKNLHILKNQSFFRLPGSGVDTERFKPSDRDSILPLHGNRSDEGIKETNFLLFGRMLWDKGIKEYVDSARVLKKTNPNASFWVLGLLDFENPTAIKSEDMQQWIEEGIIDYLGKTDRVEDYIHQADCIVYPSYYREGVPRSLLESAAMGKPIITTENIGCKEVVVEGENGYKVAPKNTKALTQAMQKFISLSNDEKLQMGNNSRKLAESTFDAKFVIKAYIEKIKSITSV